MKAVVSEKGQVTIPKRLRDSMDIRPGQVLEFEEKAGKLIGRKLDDDRYLADLEAVTGVLRDAFPGWTTDQIIDDLRGPILPGDLPDEPAG
jgi:antitoxin PrlF